MSRPTYEELFDEVLVLRQRLANMTDQGEVGQLQASLGLTTTEAKVLACLLGRPMASKDVIYVQAHEYENGDGPCIKIVDVYICKLRRKLREAGTPGQIQTVWGQGYRLDAALKAHLASVLTPGPLALAA